MKKKISTIPTIAAAILLLAGLGIGIFLLQKGTRLFSKASPETVPKQVKVTNITADSFSVSWITDSEITGFVKYSLGQTDQSLNAQDDRDQLSGKTEPFSTHHATVKNLKPSTLYSFSVGSGGQVFNNNGQPYSATTGPEISAGVLANDIAYGTIVNKDKLPAEGAVVYLSITGGAMQSVLTKSSGSWAVPLNLIRTEDLSSYLSYDSKNAQIQLFIEGGLGGTATSVTTTANDKPTPLIVLGQINDVGINPIISTPAQKVSPVPAITGVPSTGSDIPATTPTTRPAGGMISLLSPTPTTSPESLTGGKTVIILNPAEEESVSTQRPQFSGTGTPGTSLALSAGITSPTTGTAVINSNGNWTWTPTASLAVGDQKITVKYTDENGVLKSVVRNFTILSESLLPAIESSPSASPSPTGRLTATPTKKATPTPTTIARSSMPSTESGVPATGILTPTIFVLIMGIGFVLIGISSGFLLSNKG